MSIDQSLRNFPVMGDSESVNGSKSEVTPDVRQVMKEYWQQYEPSPESMMLCSAANDELAMEDMQQILQIAPTLKNKNVLELGSGIGRFTTKLAKVARTVTAVDFMESYVEKNREINGHNPHVTFFAADVTEMELPKNSFDVIFTNWLLMYLSDEEVAKLVIKMLGWLRDGGHLFIRESCYRPSGDIKRATNPTHYRSPLEYFKILQGSIYRTRMGHEFSFVCERAISIEAYIKRVHEESLTANSKIIHEMRIIYRLNYCYSHMLNWDILVLRLLNDTYA